MEMNKYSDVLDLSRSQIYITGAGYYLFNSSQPRIKLSLYLRPEYKNRETIIGIRDELIEFFGTDHWQERGINYNAVISIDFLLEEDGETKTFYKLYHSSDLYFGDYEWYEQWWDEPHGIAFMRRIIRNKEFDTLFENHANILDIEHSGAFHSGTGFIRMSLYLTIDLHTTDTNIIDDLSDFFNTNHETLADEYGTFNRIYMIFYDNTEAGIADWLFVIHGREYQWPEKRWSW